MSAEKPASVTVTLPREVVEELSRSFVERDNGYDRCIFCHAWTHMNQEIQHQCGCVAKKLRAALLRAGGKGEKDGC